MKIKEKQKNNNVDNERQNDSGVGKACWKHQGC
jgi:hypothetical protein